MKFGVSPAYFISKFGEDFTPKDLIGSLPHLKEEGYQTFQIEIRHNDALYYWKPQDVRELRSTIKQTKMEVSQFVCHHMMDDFSLSSKILEKIDYRKYKKSLDLASDFAMCKQITLPLAKGVVDHRKNLSKDSYKDLIHRLYEKISEMDELVASYDKLIGLELQPGAFINGSDGYLRLIQQLGQNKNLFYNFDTGHANASKELTHLIPYKLKGRIIGTHLCDNFGNENHSNSLGEGNIEWDKLFIALTESGYKGSYDIEILCETDQVEVSYKKSLTFLKQKLL